MKTGVMNMRTTDARAFRILSAGALAATLLAGGGAAPGPGANAVGAGNTGTIASETTLANVPRVGFLTGYERLKPLPDGSGLLCWRSADTNLKQFDKVMFERIQVYLSPGSAKPVDPTDLKMLIDYFHKSLVTAIKPVAQVVDKTGAGVLQVRIALTDLVPTNTAESLAGTAVPYGFVAEMGSGAAEGKPAGSTPYLGQTGMEVQFRDGASGKIVAECADREIGLKYAANMNAGATGAAATWVSGYMDSFSQWTYAKTAFDKWAAEFATRFAALKKG
jgi:hypothetical protein